MSNKMLFSGVIASENGDDDQVLTFAEWCALATVSPATARRMIAAGEGPTITRLSERRFGVRRRDHRLWLQSRAQVGLNGQQQKD